MDHLGPTTAIEIPPGLSFEQKWEFLRPHIECLYIDQKYKLVEVIEILKGQYGFDAT
jgi:Clr5 domain